MNRKADKYLAFGAVVILAFCVTAVMYMAETKDSPERAVVEFSKAYFSFDDDSMKDRMSEESSASYSVDDYMWNATQDAEKMGYGLWYTKNKIYMVETHVNVKDDKGTVTISLERKAPLRSFFTNEEYILEETEIAVVKENGKWKVSGELYSLPAAAGDDEDEEEDEDA